MRFEGTGHRSWITAASFDQDRVATAGDGGDGGEVIVWREGVPILSVEPPTDHAPRSTRAVLLRGETLFTAFNQRVQRWSATDGRLLSESELLPASGVLMLHLPETRTLFVVLGTHALLCLDALSLQTLRLRKLPRAKHHYEHGAVLPNGQVQLWTGRASARVDIKTCKVVASSGFPSIVYQQEELVSQDGTLAVFVETRHQRGRISATELPATALYAPIDTEPLAYGCALSGDGKLVTIHRDGARFFVARTGELRAHVALPPLEGDDTWFSVRWFPDNERILLCSRLGAVYALPVG